MEGERGGQFGNLSSSFRWLRRRPGGEDVFQFRGREKGFFSLCPSQGFLFLPKQNYCRKVKLIYFYSALLMGKKLKKSKAFDASSSYFSPHKQDCLGRSLGAFYIVAGYVKKGRSLSRYLKWNLGKNKGLDPT